MSFRKTVIAYFENHLKPTNTLCTRNEEFLVHFPYFKKKNTFMRSPQAAVARSV
jgi:hypothetical protein